MNKSDISSTIADRLNKLKMEKVSLLEENTSEKTFVQKHSLLLILIALIYMFGVIITFVVMAKQQEQQEPQTLESSSELIVDNHASHMRRDYDENYTRLQNDVDELRSVVTNQAKYLELWTHRMWVLGLTEVENTNLLKRQNEINGIPDPGYIIIDKDWKPSSKPKTLDLNEEQIHSFLK